MRKHGISFARRAFNAGSDKSCRMRKHDISFAERDLNRSPPHGDTGVESTDFSRVIGTREIPDSSRYSQRR